MRMRQLTACMLLLSLIGCPPSSSTNDDTQNTGSDGNNTGGSNSGDNTNGTGSAPLPGGVIGVKADATGKKDGSSWTDAFTDLQDALAAARVPGSNIQQIWVAKGTYKPAGPGGLKNVAFQMINDVAVYGGFAGTETALDQRDFAANVTILSGDLIGNDGPNFANRDDNALRVVAFNQLMSTAILDGFTVSGGFNGLGAGISIGQGGGTVRNCIITDNRSFQGAGAVVDDLSAAGIPVFASCTFRGNQATTYGGGALEAQGGAINVQDCQFIENSSPKGAVLFVGIGTPGQNKLTRCVFTNNTCGTGGAIYNNVSGTQITNCTFQANSATNLFTETDYGGGAIWADQPFFVVNCVFRRNFSATEGGAIRDNSSGAAIEGCLFDRNQANYGGGFFAASAVGVPSLVNCTFSGNAATSDGGGIFFIAKPWLLYNTIVWGNTAAGGTAESAQIFLGDVPDANQMKSCDVQNRKALFAGNNNISLDPLFVNAANGDLHVKSNSPVIGKGDNDLVPGVLTKDLDGNQRILGTPPVVDIGAYEQ